LQHYETWPTMGLFIGEIFEWGSKPSKAIEIYRSQLDRLGHPEFAVALADLLTRLGRVDEAVEANTRLLEIWMSEESTERLVELIMERATALLAENHATIAVVFSMALAGLLSDCKFEVDESAAKARALVREVDEACRGGEFLM
ncbi:MAG: hypothetical protein WBQ66_20670, partial [Blastocatellia bacterium]